MSYTVAKIKEDDFSFSKKGTERTYSVKYLVESTTVNDRNFLAASNASGMPKEGDKYDYDSGVFVSDISLDEVVFHSSSTTFTFSVNYNVTNGSTLSNASNNPLSAPPKIRFATARYQVPFDLAYNDGDEQGQPTKPVLNSAGLKYDPPAIKEKINSLVSITYNTKIFNNEWIFTYNDTINKSALSIVNIPIPANCGRINDLSADNNFDENGSEYWTTNITIEISKEPFKRKILDNSMMALNGNEELDNIYIEADDEGHSWTKLKSEIDDLKNKIADGLVEPASEPKNLDGKGHLLSDGEDPVYNEYSGNFAKEWNALNIPKTRGTSSNQLGGLAI